MLLSMDRTTGWMALFMNGDDELGCLRVYGAAVPAVTILSVHRAFIPRSFAVGTRALVC